MGSFPPPSPSPDGRQGAEPTVAPGWLVQRLQAAGGAVPFRTFMEWALHDPSHGAYGSGRLRVGPRGDFATSPSLGPAFGELLAPQLAEWLQALGPGPLALVETGPGEGDLARQLADALAVGWPGLAARLELVLVEPNGGMAVRQQQRLAGAPLPVRWCDWQELAARPLRGVMLAHEVLDALAVERVVWDGALWRQQMVALAAAGGLGLEAGEPVADWALAQLEGLGLVAEGPAPGRPPGWCSELHPGLEPWLRAAAAGLAAGVLLVVDYALEGRRYYSPQRSSGTLMAYQRQQASPDPLRQPGHWDLTAHLCLESLQQAAAAAGWQGLGQCRQGQALLALGLAAALYDLQQPGRGDLADRLARREALLRLVDPAGLGDFRWIALGRGAAACAQTPRFLREPAG
jgi:SAM-dependent MidA family methyltransferase